MSTITPEEVLPRAFPGISKEDIQEIISKGTIRSYPPSTILTHEGAREDIFYIILEGEVRVSKVINESEERLLKHLHPGDFFGEMAIIHQAPRAATVTTTCQTRVLEVSEEAFSSLLERSNSMSRAMIRQVSQRLRENDEMAIEDLRQKARQLAQAYQQLAELEEARREFLTTIAHEMRTPLMAANGFVQILRSGMLQGEAMSSAIDTVSRNIADIISITNNILFLQEMDLILPEFTPTDLGSVVASSVEQLRDRAGQNQVGIRVQIAPSLPRVRGDPKSLERAVSAVIDNAIKFSPDGGDISVEVNTSQGEVWVRVSDHGVGIPPQALPHIFERFFHLDQVGKHIFRGVGLGLSIARQVIEQHQGRIEVNSQLGEGSTFTIYLPR